VADLSKKVKITRTFRPQPSNRATYDDLYDTFTTIYKRNKAMYRKLNGE
jgi:sugar (pentulose or hexulose) kinase